MPSDAAKRSASTRALGVAPRRDLDFATLGPHRPLCPRTHNAQVEGASAAGGDASRFIGDAGARGTQEAYASSTVPRAAFHAIGGAPIDLCRYYMY